MADGALKIRWAPKVRPEKIRRLYEQDARGIVDDELIDDVGLALYVRCQSIVLASTGRVKCPRCDTIFQVKRPWPAPQVSPDDVARCPQCNWETTVRRYHESWRHRELHAGWGLPAIEHYRQSYPRASTPRERMLLVDQLLHSFHQALKAGRHKTPHRSVAHNLIEGNHKQALALLDQLAYGEASTPEVGDTYREWRRTAEQMGRVGPVTPSRRGDEERPGGEEAPLPIGLLERRDPGPGRGGRDQALGRGVRRAGASIGQLMGEVVYYP